MPDTLLLVYGEAADPSAHQIVRGGPELHVDSLDATLPHDVLMLRCREMAERVALITRNAATT